MDDWAVTVTEVGAGQALSFISISQEFGGQRESKQQLANASKLTLDSRLHASLVHLQNTHALWGRNSRDK